MTREGPPPPPRPLWIEELGGGDDGAAPSPRPAGGPAAATPPPHPSPPKPRPPRASRPAQPPVPAGARPSIRGFARALARLAGRAIAAAGRRAYGSRRCREGLAILVFGAAAVAASAGVRARVAADTRYRVSKESLAATAPPPGLAREAVQDLARIPLPGRSFSLYAPEVVPAIAATYAALPWVREVRKVEAIFPAVIRFDLIVRRPVAGFEHGGLTYLVDDEGLLLPRRCYQPSDPAALGLPTIERAKLGRRRLREGERLEDLPLKHGIAVALALQAEAFDPLRALGVPIRIDVANVNFEVALNQPEVVVRAGGTVIVWGRSEASSGPNLPIEQKIANFSKAVRERPLDRLSLVRLQFDQVEWRERAAAQ